MKILLKHVSSMESDSFTTPGILVTADLVQPEQVVSDIVYAEGLDFVLGAIGHDAIAAYLQKNGYTVFENESSWKAA